MKTVYLLVFVVFFASCQKEHCWECTIELRGEQPKTEIICNADRSDIQRQTESWERHDLYQDFTCKKK